MGREDNALDIDSVLLANAKAKGRRPWYLEDPAVERVLSIAMAIAAELSVCRERLDTLERLLESGGAVTQEAIEAYRPDREAERQRAQRQREYIARIMRILHQEMEDLDDGADVQRIARELSEK